MNIQTVSLYPKCNIAVNHLFHKKGKDYVKFISGINTKSNCILMITMIIMETLFVFLNVQL